MKNKSDIFNLALSEGERERLEYLHRELKDSRANILKRGLNNIYDSEIKRIINNCSHCIGGKEE